MPVRTPISPLAIGLVELTPETRHYLCRVRRLSAGDRFIAFDPQSKTEADAVIVEGPGDQLCAEICEVRPASVVAQSEVCVLYALSKGDKVDAVVRDSTELGATRILLFRASRSVVKITDEDAKRKLDRYRKVAEQAARQSGRSDPPAVTGIHDFAEALSQSPPDAEKLVCDPHSSLRFGHTVLTSKRCSLAVAIGPEGGFSEAEVQLANNHGFVSVSLGPFVLRTETVTAAVLGAWSAFRT